LLPAPVFRVINLDGDEERWKTVVTELVEKGKVPRRRIRRLPAVRGADLTSDEMRSNVTFAARHLLTRGTIGCYLSHRTFWEEVAEEGRDASYGIVLEDDVVVSEGFDRDVAKAIRAVDDELPNGEWDVLFLGAIGSVHPDGRYGICNSIVSAMAGGKRIPRTIYSSSDDEKGFLLHRPRRPMGGHAYALSKRGARKLLENCGKVSGHVDVVAWGLPSLEVVCVHPMLAHQRNTGEGSASTIGAVTEGIEARWISDETILDEYTRITLRWAFNAPVLKLGPFFLLTTGRSIVLVGGGGILASIALLRMGHPLPFAIWAVTFGILFALTKATTIRSGPIGG